MITHSWPPDEITPPADNDQREAANAFRQFGKVIIEAPPGTGKTFLGIYFALCANRLGWTNTSSPTLFLTFSRNARVQIEQELKKYRSKVWINADEEKSINVTINIPEEAEPGSYFTAILFSPLLPERYFLDQSAHIYLSLIHI